MATQKGTKYRAVCEEGDFKGDWKNTYEEALAEANQHIMENDTHIVYVELRAYLH